MNGLDIKNLRVQIGLSQKELAEKLNIHWRTVQNWEKTGNISHEDYTHLCALLANNTQADTHPNKDTHVLPLITIEAVAGFPSIDEDGVTLEDCELYNVPEFFTKGAQYLIRVSGSSMYPNYNNGDILACRKIDDITFFQWGKVYVLDTSQGALVKRIFEDTNNEENVICHSDNTELYPNFKLPKSEIRSLSIVVGVIRIE